MFGNQCERWRSGGLTSANENPMQKPIAFDRESRPAMIVVRVANRIGRRPLARCAIEGSHAHAKSLGGRIQPGHVRSIVVRDDLVGFRVSGRATATLIRQQKRLRGAVGFSDGD